MGYVIVKENINSQGTNDICCGERTFYEQY